MTKAWWALGLMLTVLIALLAWMAFHLDREPQSVQRPTATGPASAEEPDRGSRDTQRWKSVVGPYPFVFPRDHAAHDDYRIEWWYYTGNLQSDDGRPFGYQLTFFRTGIVREPDNPSRWSIRNIYAAHFAISDIRSQTHHMFQRTRRRGVGWAGAATDRYHAWNGDWEVRLEGKDHLLAADQDDCRIELRLTPLKPPVLHGDQGICRKGPTEGNASCYYSFTRLQTKGILEVGGEVFSVTGLSWMDHEFNSSFLEKGQQGWDWFAIQLDDGRQLMIYQIRRSDGTVDPHSSGTLVHEDGKPEHIHSGQFALTGLQPWKSQQTGGSYPTQWSVSLPAHRLRLSVRAAFAAQEMNAVASTGIAYWEGSIAAQGTSDGTPVSGRGYLEMTGYAGSPLGGR